MMRNFITTIHTHLSFLLTEKFTIIKGGHLESPQSTSPKRYVQFSSTIYLDARYHLSVPSYSRNRHFTLVRSFYYDVTATIARSPILSLIVTSQQLKTITLDCSQSSITEKGIHNSYHLYLTTNGSLLDLFNFAQIKVYIYRDEKQLNIKYI